MALITEAHLRKLKIKGLPNPFILNEGDKMTPGASDFLKDHKVELINKNSSKFREMKKGKNNMKIQVGVSNRHIHLTREHVDLLFGKDYQLTKLKDLSQPGQFAAKETVTLLGPKGFIHNVRILGPERNESQVEISKTDGFVLGVHPPVRLSGDIEGTPGITVIGPNGYVVLEKGVIVAKIHIHMTPEDAKNYDVNEKDTLMLQSTTDRPVIFPVVDVRISNDFALDCHIDLDEANASNIKTGDMLEVVGKNGNFYD